MKMKAIIALLALSLPAIASAAKTESFVCFNLEYSAALLVNKVKKVKLSGNEYSTTASMQFLKFGGKVFTDRIPLTGDKSDSAGGVAYDLTGPDGYELYISPIGSQSLSQLTMGKKTIDLNCF